MNIDQARTIRAGEELNLENLEAFLNESLSTQGEKLIVEQFPSGYSNLTYLLKLGERELVLRRPPFGAENISKGHDMGREYKVLSLVHPAYPKCPKPLVYTEDRSILGAPFYVMERVQGIILRANQKIEFTPTEMRSLNQNLLDALVELHQLDIEKTGLTAMGKPDGYLLRQMEGWTKRWQNAKTEEVADMEFAIDWLAHSMPASPAPSFIHNDYKYDNVVLDKDNPTQIKAV
jgi:aminoglycoside phosphotransferase (APT) family kinase protein